MNVNKYKKQLPSKREICSHYGQIYKNVKHIKRFINVLTRRYIKDNLI
jgi:hypothetical protein